MGGSGEEWKLLIKVFCSAYGRSPGSLIATSQGASTIRALTSARHLTPCKELVRSRKQVVKDCEFWCEMSFAPSPKWAVIGSGHHANWHTLDLGLLIIASGCSNQSVDSHLSNIFIQFYPTGSSSHFLDGLSRHAGDYLTLGRQGSMYTHSSNKADNPIKLKWHIMLDNTLPAS